MKKIICPNEEFFSIGCLVNMDQVLTFFKFGSTEIHFETSKKDIKWYFGSQIERDLKFDKIKEEFSYEI